MPDIGSARVQEIPTYTGSRDSSRIVYATRTKIEQLSPPQDHSEQGMYPDLSSPPSYSSTLSDSSLGGQQRPPRQQANTGDYQDDSFDSFESD